MKLKHGQRVVAYQWSDFSTYQHREQYLHPQITIQFAKVVDETEDFKTYGYESCLAKAKLLRDETRNTIHFDMLSGSGGNNLTFRWQTDRRYHDGTGYYGSLYACQINNCGMDVELIALALKIAKLGEHGWSTQPLQIVDALQKLKAVPVVYNRATDCFLAGEHLNDNLFGLPAEQRTPEGVEA